MTLLLREMQLLMKRVYGSNLFRVVRKDFWARYSVNVIFLDIIEMILYGYSAREGRDMAAKLELPVGEMQSQIPMRNFLFPTIAFLLAELQLRGVKRSDGIYSLTNSFIFDGRIELGSLNETLHKFYGDSISSSHLVSDSR